MTHYFFILFTLFIIACSLGVVFARNVIFSALSLVLTFFGLAAIYVMWGSTLLAALQVLIYTGAIVVLFVFVIMLLDTSKMRNIYSNNTAVVLVTLFSVWTLSVLILRSLNRAQFVTGESFERVTQLDSISMLLFTDHLWAFEILSVFLLALILTVCILIKPGTLLQKSKKATGDKA